MSDIDSAIIILWNDDSKRLEAHAKTDQRKVDVTYPAGRVWTTVAEAKLRLRIPDTDTVTGG